MNANELIIASLVEHATGGMEDIVREVLYYIEDSGVISDMAWACMTKEDVEALSEAIYGVVIRAEEIIGELAD